MFSLAAAWRSFALLGLTGPRLAFTSSITADFFVCGEVCECLVDIGSIGLLLLGLISVALVRTTTFARSRFEIVLHSKHVPFVAWALVCSGCGRLVAMIPFVIRRRQHVGSCCVPWLLGQGVLHAWGELDR
jgi:hypothetical protein